jgi:hypothetical protein
VGQRYDIGTDKLLRKKSLTKKTLENGRQYVETNRTFFCSELVAKALKILNVIVDDDTSCTQFYPHHFSEKGDSFLKLEEGVKIMPEMQIIIKEDALYNK